MKRLLPALFLASVLFAPAADLPKARVAVIGGTYLNDILMDSGWLKERFTLETKAGRSLKSAIRRRR